LRLIAFDYYQRLDPQPYDPNLPVRIVDIDEKSLAMFGQWPWPRWQHSQGRRQPARKPE
jgi:adenylate cyclase